MARILICEDDREMAEILNLVLGKTNHEVRVIHNGIEALECIKTWRPQLLVLDIMLPGIDGFHICQTIKEDHSFESLPSVLIISSRATDWDKNLGAACGAEDYLVKPFTTADFLQKVNKIISDMEGKNA